MSNYLSIDKRKQIFHLLCEGNGIRSITRLVGCSTCSVTEIQRRYSTIIDFLDRRYILNLEMPEIEADEIRTYVLNKKNVRWVYIALDRKSRMIIHFHIGSRDANDAEIFLSGLSDKLSATSQVSTDCLASYVSAVNKTRSWNDFYSTEAIDLYSARHLGRVLGRGITNHIERANGTVRQHVSKLTRKTLCFAKKDESLRQHLSLFFFYYNFMKVTKLYKTVPAVSAGLIESKFTFDTLIEYDLMFTGNSKNIDSKSIYGRVERGKSKHEMSKEDKNLFLSEIINTSGVKFYQKNMGKYENKLRIA